jgi:hypothetical protein
MQGLKTEKYNAFFQFLLPDVVFLCFFLGDLCFLGDWTWGSASSFLSSIVAVAAPPRKPVLSVKEDLQI